MDNLSCKPATIDDVNKLAEISLRAFHSDFEVGAPNKIGGPPGYDSPQFHAKILRMSHAFYKILDKDEIIGGFFIFLKSKTHMELSRIFIDPGYHRKGVGLRSLNYLFKKYPYIKKWTLDTPKWNIRTMNFYKKLGFFIEKEDDCFYYFTKNISE
ncbi:MAG: GNAT family N-acetyltransferase [Spirochaetales bacterium]|nr:GNAT family N-acetyltransferase [Spirochaetales bacterium]